MVDALRVALGADRDWCVGVRWRSVFLVRGARRLIAGDACLPMVA